MRSLSYLFILIAPHSFVFGIDENGDGMSDVWQSHYGVAPNTGSEDSDHDGYSNLYESLFGTDPFSAASAPGLELTTYEGFRAVTWQTVLGVRYQLKRSSNLIEWEDSGSERIGDGRPYTVYFPNPWGRRFMRLDVLTSADEDQDGLDAFEEGLLGTSDTKIDSDGDNVPDIDEFKEGLSPTDASSADGDPIPDDWEIHHLGTTANGSQEDTDGDGFTLLDEFRFDLDPGLDDFTTMVTHLYTYDANGRLTDVNHALAEHFAFDAEGNLLLSQ